MKCAVVAWWRRTSVKGWARVYTGEEPARGGGGVGRNLLGRPPGEARKGVATISPLMVVGGERNGCTECYLLCHRSMHQAAELEPHSPPGSQIPISMEVRSLERGRRMQACDLFVGLLAETAARCSASRFFFVPPVSL